MFCISIKIFSSIISQLMHNEYNHCVGAKMPMQVLPPLVIITGAFALSGAGIYTCQKVFDGRTKHVGADEFDRLVTRRDSNLPKQS